MTARVTYTYIRTGHGRGRSTCARACLRAHVRCGRGGRGSRLWIDASTGDLGKGRAQLWQQGRAAVARGRSWRWLTVHAAQVLFPKTQEGPFTFIPYPSGMGIIYSSDVAEHVARLMGGPLSLRTIWPHDAMSAVRLAGVDVELKRVGMYVCRKVKNSQARTGHQRGMGANISGRAFFRLCKSNSSAVSHFTAALWEEA